MKNTDHVLSHDGSRGFFGFSCAHCGTKQTMATPIAVEVYCAAGKAFEELHADCPPPKVPK